jgi:hypothetical protein
MNRACKTVPLVAFLALLTTAPAFTQTLSGEATTEAKAAAPVADVYVQTSKGVNVYDATTAGKLTLVKGSPFSTSGQMEGNNGKYLISVGTDYLRTYAIESTGAVGKQASEIDTQDFSGSECGDTNGGGSVLDHTGEYFHVSLDSFGSVGNCDAWQSYQITSSGGPIFLGDVEAGGYSDGWSTGVSIPTISGDDMFGYGITYSYTEGTEFNQNAIVPFARNAVGVLQSPENFTETDPTGNPNMVGNPNFSAGGWYPTLIKADPAGHLAALLFEAQLIGAFDPPILRTYP